MEQSSRMAPPWYCAAYQRLEREIKTTLEELAGDHFHVKEIKPEIPERMIAEYSFSIFEFYDDKNNLAAKVKLASSDSARNLPLDGNLTFIKGGDDIQITGYNKTFNPTIMKFLDSLGNIDEKIEQYAEEYLDLGEQLSDAAHTTILGQPFASIKFLQPYALKFLESLENETVGDFYREAQWNAVGIAEAFGITEKDVNNLVEQIRAQLPQKYLDLEKQVDEF